MKYLATHDNEVTNWIYANTIRRMTEKNIWDLVLTAKLYEKRYRKQYWKTRRLSYLLLE